MVFKSIHTVMTTMKKKAEIVPIKSKEVIMEGRQSSKPFIK